MSTPFAADVPPPPTLTWVADVLPGYEQAVVPGLPAPDGPIEVVLVRLRGERAGDTGVLYVHGFVDYFFQAHLGEWYGREGLHFYALELRRHGRALRAHQVPNFTADVDEYLADVDLALGVLRAQEGLTRVVLNGHSTGGLVAALYAHRGRQRDVVAGVVLNSPFLDMNLPRWQQRLVEPLLAWVGAWAPRLRLQGLNSAYGQSLHAQHHGEWHYNTAWKPIGGFTVYAGWFRAIHRAHAEVERGLSIGCPCLVLHAQRSVVRAVWSADVMRADAVLNVDDMRRLAPRLGPDVQCVAIADGIHDLMLSAPAARQDAWRAVGDWLRRFGVAHATAS